MPSSSFGQRLRLFRDHAKLSQTELAARSGLSLSVITKLEQGIRADPNYSTVVALASVLGVSTDDFKTSEQPGKVSRKQAKNA